MSTKVVTGKVRFSYVNVFAPRASEDGGDPKYSLTVLIPKSDTATLNKIKAAIAEARDTFCERNGANSLPAKPLTPLHDGDGMKPTSGEPYGPECKGCYVMAVSSKQKPVIANACADFCASVREQYGRYDFVFYDAADPALGNRVAAVLQTRGLPSRNVVASYKVPLEERPVTVDGLLCSGRLRINKTCTGVIRALSQLRWDEAKPNIPEDKNIGNIKSVLLDKLPFDNTVKPQGGKTLD